MSPADRPRKSDDIDGGWAKRAARKQETRRDAASGKSADRDSASAGNRGGQGNSESRQPYRSDRDTTGYRGRADRRFEGKPRRTEKPVDRTSRESGYGAGRSESGRTGYGRADRSAQAPGGKGARAWDDKRTGRPEGRGYKSDAEDFGRRRSSEGDSFGGRRSSDAGRSSGGYRSDASGRGADPGSGSHRRRGADDVGGRPERPSSAQRSARSAAKPVGAEKTSGKRARRTGSVDPAREVALEVLRAVRERDAYANLVLPGLLRDRRVSGRDAALATELAYGACRTQGLLDAVIAHGAGRSVEEIDGPLLDVLRLGVYQLLRTRIGAHAAVDTSVALARAEFGAGKSGFVNAVLRRAGEKTAEEWVEELAPEDPVGRLAFEYAHPTWIAQAFADALGARAGELRDLLAADDDRPVVHLVARPGEITAEELALVTGGEEGRWSPYAVYLEGGDPGKLEPVREGMAAVQDEGSQLVALSLTRAPLEGPDGGRWLDLCAGPGGKAALLGALAAIDRFQVDAVEPAEHRAELVRKATHDLPVRVHVVDGRDSGLEPGYDRILVDAPCTGLGALRRRPEARWRRSPADVRDLVVLQRELLTAAWDLLRPGGVVVYSTCSPHLAETVSIVADHVRRTGAVELDTRDLLPGVTDVGDGPAAQLWPHRHGTDAMFMAALRKPS
ncbi:16S rRNA (cytosine967-C5)-methyltransferase [Nocardia bhagyanarayanae]|uniref:16S rRNA (Cytosine967-C5)-methyltransferase n=1 Tax=Nocardia bhagyanarayanae TaxID=1215925 RepID=A0A543FDM2_9NOCA|nr:16S rRNA (cytosine967-C5)-methyltransferase [Nocardia bhagyanarayanae]